MKTKKTTKKPAKKAAVKKQPTSKKAVPKSKKEKVTAKVLRFEPDDYAVLKDQVNGLKELVKSQKETISRLRKRNKALNEKAAKKGGIFPTTSVAAPTTTVTSMNHNAGTDSEFLTKIAMPSPIPVTKAVPFPESPFSKQIAPPLPAKTSLDNDLSTFRVPCIQDADKDSGASLLLGSNPLSNACAVKY